MSDTERSGAQFADFGILLLRLGIGAGIMTHGYPKLFGGPDKQPPDAIVTLLGKNLPASFEHGGIEGLSGSLERMGIPYPRQAALLAGLAEFGGGLTLVLGFKTRLAAVPVLIAMLVAIGKAHWKTGSRGKGDTRWPISMRWRPQPSYSRDQESTRSICGAASNRGRLTKRQLKYTLSCEPPVSSSRAHRYFERGGFVARKQAIDDVDQSPLQAAQC